MATDKVYNLLKDQNRPFSANDVLESVGKEHGKAAVQKALDGLVNKMKIFEKMYGKQKIYCVIQDKTSDKNQMGKELREMDQEIGKLTEVLKNTDEQLQIKTTQLQTLRGKMTTSEAKTKRNQMREEILIVKEKLQSYKENTEPISPEEKMEITKGHEMYMKEYKKRKRMCMDVLNSILENYPKTKKHLFEEIGIETDEDVKFKLE